jgi:hypothetical protein
MAQTQRVDATPMLRGAIFQLCVAVERCYRLKPGQSVHVEELGDVSIPGETQTEVKHYAAPLTDNHPNFWNTLYNWTEPDSQADNYRFLILHTTQEFGARSRLAEFNSMSTKDRMQLLLQIHGDLELEHLRRNGSENARPSPTLVQQRALLSADRRERLDALLEKVCIEARCANASELYEQLCQEKAGHVLDDNARIYIDALIGLVCRPVLAGDTRWTISFDEFKVHLQYLTSIYCSASRQFPRAEFERLRHADFAEMREDMFVRKIVDVGGNGKVITTAIREYEATTATIAAEFRRHTSAAMQLSEFEVEVIGVFEARHLRACLEPAHDENSSMRFYLNMIASTPPSFSGYTDSPHGFRNGVLHMTMNDQRQEYIWKVTKK